VLTRKPLFSRFCVVAPLTASRGALLQECQAQLQESILVWLQSTAEDAGGAGPGTNPQSLDESGDAPDMPRLKRLAKHGAELVAELLGAAL